MLQSQYQRTLAQWTNGKVHSKYPPLSHAAGSPISGTFQILFHFARVSFCYLRYGCGIDCAFWPEAVHLPEHLRKMPIIILCLEYEVCKLAPASCFPRSRPRRAVRSGDHLTRKQAQCWMLCNICTCLTYSDVLPRGRAQKPPPLSASLIGSKACGSGGIVVNFVSWGSIAVLRAYRSLRDFIVASLEKPESLFRVDNCLNGAR